MYYYRKNSRRKIVHAECCHFRRILNPETTGYFQTLAEAYSAGYRLCAHCDALSKQYRKEEQDLQEYCRNNGLSVHLGKRGIWVRSPRSEWRIMRMIPALGASSTTRTICTQVNDPVTCSPPITIRR